MEFIKLFRPELAHKTQSLYARELNYLFRSYNTKDPLTLYEYIYDIAMEELTLDHLTLEGLQSHKTLRCNVFRILDDLFGDNNDMIDTLITCERLKI